MNGTTAKPPPRLTARTLSGRIEIRELVNAARRNGWIHIRRPRKEVNPPKHKLALAN